MKAQRQREYHFIIRALFFINGVCVCECLGVYSSNILLFLSQMFNLTFNFH